MEEQVKNIVEGTDANELFADQTTRDVKIQYKDKEWTFSVRTLTWKEKGDCMTAATNFAIKGKKR